MNVTTLANLKRHIGLAGDSEDAALQTILAAVSAQIEAYLARALERVERIEQHDVERGQRVFLLQAYPVDTASAFEVRNDAAREFGVAIPIDPDNFYLHARSGRLTFDHSGLLSWGPGTLQVLYTGGMGGTTSDIQSGFPDVEMAGILQAGHLFQRRHDLGITTVSSEGGSVSAIERTPLLDRVRGMLDLHRRRAA